MVTLLTSNQSTSQQISLGKVSGVPLPRSPISLNSNASTAGPSAATPPSTGMDGRTATVKTTDSSTSSSELVRVATDRTLSVESNEQEAEIMLLEFKVNMTEQFPFVMIPTDSTSQSLQRERPLLWKAIMVAASHENSDRQLALGFRMIDNLTPRLLFRAEKSLELLQALLVLIAMNILSLNSSAILCNIVRIDGTAGTTIILSSTHK